MNVLEALIAVIPKQLAITLMEVTPALATLDTQAVGVLAQVGAGNLKPVVVRQFPIHFHSAKHSFLCVGIQRCKKCVSAQQLLHSHLITVCLCT